MIPILEETVTYVLGITVSSILEEIITPVLRNATF